MALKTKTVKSNTTANGYTLELRLVEESVSVENNTSSVSWSLVLTSGDYRFSRYRIGWSVSLGDAVVSSRARAAADQRSMERHSALTVVSGTAAVPHGADGALDMACAASIDVEAQSYTPGAVSLAGAMALTDIPRASALEVSDGTLGTAQTLVIRRASTAFTHTLSYVCGSDGGSFGMSHFTGDGLTLTYAGWTPRLTLAAQNTAGNSVSVTFTLTTLKGGATVGTAARTVRMAIPESVKPAVTAFSVSPDNAGTAAAGVARYVQGVSRLSYSVSASGAGGSAVTGTRLRIAFRSGGEYTAEGGVSGVLPQYGYADVYATVTDSRGRTSEPVKKTIYVYQHGLPVISGFQAYRVDENGDADESGDRIRIAVASAAPGGTVGGANAVQTPLAYSVRSNSTGAVVDSGALTPGTPVISTRNRTISYTVSVTAADTLGAETTLRAVVPSETVTLNLKRGGRGAAFGKYAQTDDLLDVAWDASFDGNVKGRVLGLGQARGAVSEGDLNGVTEPGVYRVDTASTKVVRNVPSHAGGTLRVWTAAGTAGVKGVTILQEYVDVSGRSWRRRGTTDAQGAADSWGAWRPRNGEKAYRQANPPNLGVTPSGAGQSYWQVLLAGDRFVAASLALKNCGWRSGGEYAASGMRYSGVYRLTLPFPMNDVTLTGSGEYGVTVTDAEQDGPAGVTFRLLAPRPVDGAFTLRLQLMGGVREASADPPDWGEYGGTEHPVTVAKSYWRGGEPVRPFVYSSDNWSTAGSSRVNDGDGNGCIVCDTFVWLCLRGLKYDQSPYGRKTAPDDEIDRDELPANQNGWNWVGAVNRLLLGAETPEKWREEGQQSVPAVQPDAGSWAARYFGANMHNTYQLLWVMWQNGLIFTDASQVKSGDLAFWADHSNELPYFDSVSHVALVGVEDGVPYLYEATGYSLDGKVLQRIPLADKVPQPTYFARVDYRT